MSTTGPGAGHQRVPPAPLRTATVDGLAVTRRRPETPAAGVVIVHGAMDRAATFSRVMRRLGEFDVVAYDRRGYAGSRTSGTVRAGPIRSGRFGCNRCSSDVHDPLCGHARDLLTVVEWVSEQDPDLPRLVVGHSLGALIALVAAATPCGPASGDGDIPDPATVLLGA
ncbi:MAG: alpha/beta fold hydrolase [Microthrixaceae bacterium]|nr:alpha/beta fold hydrolase [Microthrixaceae bacterium]